MADCEAADPERIAACLRERAERQWRAASDDPSALAPYTAAVEALAAMSGGQRVARQQLLCLRDRMFPDGGYTDPEGQRDFALLTAAIANL